MLEHEQERALIEQIETAVVWPEFPSFCPMRNKLSSTLRNHIYKEDDILFEFAKTALRRTPMMPSSHCWRLLTPVSIKKSLQTRFRICDRLNGNISGGHREDRFSDIRFGIAELSDEARIRRLHNFEFFGRHSIPSKRHGFRPSPHSPRIFQGRRSRV